MHSAAVGERSVEFDFRSTATGKTALGTEYADAVIKIEYTAKFWMAQLLAMRVTSTMQS